ncbi:hypothetical protein H6G96_30640 [Nostoc sp. FACHB-892]|uniref:hypothetical protein n=1 Tax=Nostoc sp. FACHB-892 TaxID=2692843 RepID=UPI0016825ABF|nr:hypothetical protein [Nostoc sp. FACHB-892]MBD2730558.1 hypothetical protein [Nostoc sp. FACHB-892]
MPTVLNWDDEFSELFQKIRAINLDFRIIYTFQQKESDVLANLENEILSIAEEIGISSEELNNILNTPCKISQPSNDLQWDDNFFLNYNPSLVESKIKEEVLKNPDFLPTLSTLDYIIVALSGLIATIVDILIVKIPKDINYLGKYQQQGSNFTQWLKNLGIDEEGKLNLFLRWCENVCKVPYDQSINPEIKGFTPKTHRLLSLGHDPLFGLIFGTLDILNGTLTAFDTNGKLRILKTFDILTADKAFAPLIWLGHIVSDVCTKAGIPIPGWGFLQLLQFGSFGSNQKTIADISGWMYLNGYDLRHFITMSTSVAVIELIVRGYHYLSCLENQEQLQNFKHTSIGLSEIAKIKSNLKLHKMLFLAHGMAASGNLLKIFIYSGNPVAINLPQWLSLMKESVHIIQASARDTTSEKIIRNREKINEVWKEIM